MGCDGGTIPKRDELVRTKKKKETLSRDVTNAAKWNHCHLSQEKLRKPIVADQFGFLYNKESILEFILDRSKYECGPEYIKGLRDVKELKLVENPGFVEESNQLEDNFMFICPITGLQMNGIYKFYFILSCGCVFSERAYKTLNGSDGTKCIKCEKPFKKTDLITLNPNDEADLEANKQKILLRKTETSSKRKVETETDDSVPNKAEGSKKSDNSAPKKVKANSTAASFVPVAAASSVQNDPNTSEVYKSLFTSHEKAKNQTKAHWVTFNPQYF